MKRYILFLLAIATAFAAWAEDVTALSDLDATQSYYVRQGTKGYLYAAGGKACADGKSTATADDAHRWAVAYNEKLAAYFLYNLSDSTFLSTAGGECPLVEAAVPVYLFQASAGAWYAYTSGGVVGLSENTSGDILLQGENAALPDALSFEPAGALDAKHQSKIRAAVWLAVTQETAVPVITSIGTRISSLSEITDGASFLLYSTGFSKYAYDVGTALSFGTSAPSKNNLTGMPYVFTFHRAGDGWTIETGVEGNYISGLSGSAVLTGVDATSFTITASSTAGSFNLYSASSSQYINAQSAKPVGWGSSEGNSRYQLIPVTLTNSDKYFPVTYMCYETDGEHTRLMDVQTYAKSTNRLTPPTFTGYRRLSTKAADGESSVSTAVTEPVVVCVTYERNLRNQPVVPTTISGTAFADTTTWYTIKVAGRYMQVQSDAVGHYMLGGTTLKQITDDALWCFVGDNVSGYRLYNRAAGTAMSLSLGSEPMASDVPFIRQGATDRWAISNGTASGTWYVSPVVTGDVGVSPAKTPDPIYLADDGQRKLSVTAGTAAVVIDAAAAVMQDFAANAATNLGTNVGQYPAAEATALVSAADGYSLTAAAFNRLQAAYNAFRSSAERVAIDRDMLYRVVAADGTVLSAPVDGEAATAAAADVASRDQLWRLLPLGSTGSYYLLNPENGGYLGAASATRGVSVPAAPTTHSYALANAAGTLSTWTLKDNGTSGSTSYVTLSDDGAPIGGRSTAESAAWRIEPVTQFIVSTEGVDGVCAATVCLPFAAALPADLTAAAITEKGDASVTVEPLQGSVIPAGTPVLLVSATPRTYTLTPAQEQGEAVTTNLLVGIDKRTALGADDAPAADAAFVLDAQAQFVSASGPLPAYTAYLDRATTDAAALALVLPTAIGQVTLDDDARAAAGQWYDLQGRPVANPQRPGIFITGGRKVVVK